MKSKRFFQGSFITLVICLVTVLTIFGGCFSKKPYRYLQDKSEIEQVLLINKIDGFEYSKISDEDYRVLSEIGDIPQFLKEFEQIGFTHYLFGEPKYINDGDNAILIIYKNGDLEGVTYYTQYFEKSGETGDGRYYCDKEQFETFFQTWLEKSI